MSKENPNEFKIINKNERLKYRQTINELKQQLEEKEDECSLYKKFADGGAIDLVIESVGRLREIDQLKQQLEEKDKEIERLKVFERIYYQNQLQASQEDIQKFQQLANQSAVNINHIAIIELEKVKMQLKDKTKMMSNEEHCYQQKVVSWIDICDQINNQIKELKGE